MNISDFASESTYNNPYPLYEQLREKGALVSLLPTLWITGRYAVTQELLRDKHVGRDVVYFLSSRFDDEAIKGAAFQVFGESVLMMNSLEHSTLRGMLAKVFSPRHMEEFREVAQRTTNKLIDGFYAEGTVDLISQYARKIPVVVICKLLGLDEEDTRLFTQELWCLTSAIGKTLELTGVSYHDLSAGNAAAIKLYDFFRLKLEQRKNSPADDLISLLLSLENSEFKLTDDQIISNIIFLFTAGHETSGNMIGNAIVCLYKHPEVYARLTQDKTLLPGFVLECLRYETSLQIAAREILEDFEFEGFKLRRGDTVILCLGSANRDPQQFDRPDEFIIDRLDLNARQLTSFGGGIHYCLGARLALMEIEVAIQALIERIPALQVTDLENMCWHPTHTVRGVSSLDATWARSL